MDWNSRLIPNARLMLFAFHIGRARLRRSTLEKSFSGLASGDDCSIGRTCKFYRELQADRYRYHRIQGRTVQTI